MRFGIFLEFSRTEGVTPADAYARGLHESAVAEEAGLDVVHLSEFHFNPVRVLSSPLMMAAAIAARTKRVRVGTSVLVIPLANPLRTAEETAVLDHISGGRLDVGVGRSSFERAYLGYNMQRSESRDRFAECMDILIGLWTQDGFSYGGQFYSYNNVTLMPKPVQQPHPPVWVAATNDDTFPMVARMGFSLFVGLREFGLPRVKQQVATYRAAWEEGGHEGPARISVRLPIYIAPTHEEAIREAEPSFMRQFNSPVVQANANTPEEIADTTWERVIGRRAIVGSPTTAIEQIKALKDALGLEEVVGELNAGEHIPPELTERSVRLLGTEVAPAFR